MKTLDDSILQLGDIILVTSDEKVSKGIRIATNSDVSHAMVYVEAFSVVDSDREGVHARSTQRMFWPDHCAAHVLRVRGGLSDEELQRVLAYARGQVGTRYAIIEAVRSAPLTGARTTESRSRRQFCSRLVAQAYEAAGRLLVESPNYCTPEDIRRSEALVEVPNATRIASEAEIAAMNASVDLTQIMRDTTNTLLKRVREIDGEIESLNDINTCLVAHPEHDARIAQLFRETGYLTVWQMECSRSPWHYDLQVMLGATAPDSEKRWYCETTLRDYEIGLQRYEVNRAGYSILFETHRLESFRLLKGLYEKLVELHRLRGKVAAEWLSRATPGSSAAPQSPDPLVPHSSEWFLALERCNPVQAAHTRSIIKQADSRDVCSICGDVPAKDYRLVGHAIQEGAVTTLRLCDDCWGIRRAMYTESFGLQ